VGSNLAQAGNISTHLFVLLLADLNKTLHRCFADANIGRLHGLVENLAHYKVALFLILKVMRRIRNGVQQGLDGQAARLHVRLVLADVVSQGHHDLILQLSRQVLRLQLLANVANSCQRCESNLGVLVTGVGA